MIIHVSGKTRRGKSSLVTAMVLDKYMKYYNSNYTNCCSYIKWQNKTYGRNLSLPPQRHVVCSNFDLTRKYPNMQSYQVSGYTFGAPNQFDADVKPLIPYGVYIFDECQRYWDSKEDRHLPPWVTQAFELSGQAYLTIYLISQRYIRLHPDIRAIVDLFIYVEESEHTFIVNGKKVKSDKFLPFGRLVKTEWKGREFEDEGDIEAYIKSKENKHLGKPFKYVFHGDIRKHYNPTNYAVNLEDLSKDYRYFDDVPLSTKRPASWDNYKKTLTKKDKKEVA